MPELTNKENSSTYIIALVAYLGQSPVVLLLFLIAVFCAILSTADTFLLAASQAYLTDVLQLKELMEPTRYESRVDKHGQETDTDYELLEKARKTNTILAFSAAAACFSLVYAGLDYIDLLFVVFAGQGSLWPSVVRGLWLAKCDRMSQGASEELKALASLTAGYGVVFISLLVGLSLLWFSEIDECIIKSWFFYYSPIYVVVFSGLAYLFTPHKRLQGV